MVYLVKVYNDLSTKFENLYDIILVTSLKI